MPTYEYYICLTRKKNGLSMRRWRDKFNSHFDENYLYK